jgi:23S rRNA pseudouridine1911/1915/1917 synthase
MPLRKIYKFKITESDANQRLDKFLSSQIILYSRSYFKKLIESGHIKLNNKIIKPSQLLSAGDSLECIIPAPEETNITSENIPLDIIFEDKDLLVLNKPAYMVVHPGAGIKSGTLVNALMHRCKDLSGIGGRLRPGIVHRLDKNTTGLLVVAKNDYSHIKLQEQFQEKTAQRSYKALIWGHPDKDSGIIETLVNRSKSDRKKFTVSETGKSAVTEFKVEKKYAFFTLLIVQLKTGRTHQIRIHFNHIHHPVFGDPDYSGRNKQIKQLNNLTQRNFALNLLKKIDRQALHSFRLKLNHPSSGKLMTFEAPLPADFENIILDIEEFEKKI